jgi:hypothetical protein
MSKIEGPRSAPLPPQVGEDEGIDAPKQARAADAVQPSVPVQNEAPLPSSSTQPPPANAALPADPDGRSTEGFEGVLALQRHPSFGRAPKCEPLMPGEHALSDKPPENDIKEARQVDLAAALAADLAARAPEDPAHEAARELETALEGGLAALRPKQ